MKIFISWSGEYTHQVALHLKTLLIDLLQGVRPFVSSEDIRKGSRWPLELAQELRETSFSIVCLDSSNLTSPWVMFEAGAISKTLEQAQVCVLLLAGLKSGEVVGPLAAFQHTVFTQEDVRKLLHEINPG